jgi:hypothetical protein
MEKGGLKGIPLMLRFEVKSTAWERRGRLPTEAKNIRDLFSLYGEKHHDIIKK